MSRPPTFWPNYNSGAKPTCLHRSKALDASFPVMQTRRLSPRPVLREQHARTVGNPNTVLQLAAAAAISQPPAGRDMREFPTRVNSDNYEKWAVYSWNPSIFSSVTSDPGVRGLGKSARAGVLGAAPYRTGRGWTTEQHRGDPGWAPAAGARVCSEVTSW